LDDQNKQLDIKLLFGQPSTSVFYSPAEQSIIKRSSNADHIRTTIAMKAIGKRM
jgi:hypothetical protein